MKPSVIYEIARWAVVLVAVIFLIVMFSGNTVSTADPADVEAAVTAELDMSSLLPGDNQMFKRLYGLDPSQYEACILYYPATNMMAEELLIVKLADVSQQETVQAAVEDRIATQKNTFEGYGVAQFEMLTNQAVVEVRGNYILFVVSADSAAARSAFLDAI